MFDREVEIENIKRSSRELVAAEKRKDLETALSYYSDDIYFVPPGGQILHGKDEIEPFLASVIETPYTNRIEWVGFHFSDSGDLASSVARYNLTLEEGAIDVPLRGKFLAVWRKMKDRWIIEMECFNGYE
jgi:uncharacterized protein (TIGR02246 family)